VLDLVMEDAAAHGGAMHTRDEEPAQREGDVA
jgi:ribose transport system ATP-binding protein